jgi:ATP-dependent helicase HepA
MSEREPELGLGIVASIDRAAKRIAVDFPAAKEKRLYALGTPVLNRVIFRAGETLALRDGSSLVVEGIDDANGLIVYSGHGRSAGEDEISDVTSVRSPAERFMAGQVDENDVFDLRLRTLEARAKFRQSEVRGFLGGRLELIPHQFYILREVAGRQIPRVLLADEVGLGKTIEACLIVQRLLAVGWAQRVLVLVPESLIHQWFVELLRRFNLWFSIYDEERCANLEASDPGENPFLAGQLTVCSVSFLAGNEKRAEQAVAAGWDIVVVDEAHHLEWSPQQSSAEYHLVETLAARAPGLLLLTATPTQLGLEGHFARLRLLDPDRYTDFASFQQETQSFGAVADIADKLVAKKPLSATDQSTLKQIFRKDPERLNQLLEWLQKKKPGAHDALLQTLLDQHGTGRVMFRNTRAAMTGFPKRKFSPVPLEDAALAIHARIARELQAEEERRENEIRYSFKGDPRIDWLADFLRQHRADKVLLICKSLRKVTAIEAALQEKISAKVGLFHEGLPLIQRDRNAAWFAEPEGAQLLICSEIGSEGRNFQFAHHLVLFDLPLNPGLVEQRIGRLDRIGQTQTIRVHVPYVRGSADECVVEWYHRGLDAFETPLHSGSEYQTAFRERVLELSTRFADGGKVGRAQLEALIEETAGFRAKLTEQMHRGRDRLLELNSFNREIAERVIEQVKAADADVSLRNFLLALLDQFGVRVREHEEGDVFLDPSHAYIESFPSIPADGMLATFNRSRAVIREDIRFITADHSLVRDAIDLLIDSPTGTTAFGTLVEDEPNLLLEAVFVVEVVAEVRWHVDQFLAPTPLRLLIDARGHDWSEERGAASVAAEVEDADVHRFLERGFDVGGLKNLIESAEERAEQTAARLKSAASERAAAVLNAEVQRLLDLKRVNDHIRPEEIALAREKLERTRTAIAGARLRLDSLRVVLVHTGDEE